MTDRASETLPAWIRAAAPVAADLRAGKAVVALESTVITHGLPRPVNLEIARQMESQVSAAGARPATVAVLDGQICLGLTPEELERLALSPSARKLNRRDLGAARAKGESGGTTVSATMYVAHGAGIRVFATGGIGGVHPGAGGDVSADLTELAQTAVAVVCSGAKAILDLPRTLEWLETAGVPVIGWRTDEFPAFFSRESGLSVSTRADTPAQAAAILRSHWELGSKAGALVCVACPEEEAVPRSRVEAAVSQALAIAESVGVTGKDLTPFLLARVAELSGDATLRANLALLRHNARVAAEIALALAGPAR
ncbi:MAG TPA: pseudouridine-5'-phosphate glycosidase [Anaerolineales bacterium]|nr:pseudouridine-5'-phosphate glycosidase [Anaerolineales bacterium]